MHPNSLLSVPQATSTLAKNYWTSSDCIPALFEIITSSPDQNVRVYYRLDVFILTTNAQIRQLAAVELRKRVNQHQGQLWVNVPQNLRNAIKERVTQVILAEPAQIVRHAIARVISAIAQYELQGGTKGITWGALIPWVEHSCVAEQAAHREVGVYVLFTILDSLMDEVSERLTTFFALFDRLIQDSDSAEVRVTAVRCLGQVAQYIDSDQKEEIVRLQLPCALLARILNLYCVETIPSTYPRNDQRSC